MDEPAPGSHEFSLKGFVISLLASSGAGMIMTLLFAPGDRATKLELALFGAVAGLLIGLPFYSLERIFGDKLDSLAGATRVVARAIAYMMAGLIGFGLGFPIAGLVVFGIIFRFPVTGGLFVAAIASTIVAFMIYGYGVLRSRLEASLARIKEQEFAEKELELARSIQRRLLPPEEIEGDGYRIVARNVAATYVAGDFYDVFHLEDGTVGIAVADVAGKGMGASLIMSSAKAMLPLIAIGRSVSGALRELNTKLKNDLDRREFVALAFARFDPSTGSVEVGNAGLPNAFLIDGSGASEIDVPGPRLPLGTMKGVPYESTTLTMKPGEKLLLLSDGLPEAPLGDGEQLGYEELQRIISDTTASDASAWLDGVFQAILARTPDGPDDDCTALVIERTMNDER